ncbi:hypothetical protein [Streptomyces longisporoflavus]|uniref:Uncharacterized protein n=1 Tax=Streptomyces longisporoflavus TaxID=28044 RepID=A0ABW7QEU5_9ACTN
MNTTDATRMLRQAEHAYGAGNFARTVNLLDRISTDRPGLPVDGRASYDALRALLAERAGNWPEAVHRWLAVFGTTPPASGEDQPCDDGCDCDVRTVLDAPGAASSETPCLCCPAHALWRLVWQAARQGAIGEVLDAVPDPSGNRRTALVHALAIGTLRSLAESGTADPAHAVFAIAVWRLLLGKQDLLGFEDLVIARRGAPIHIKDWLSACDRLAARIRTALRSIDERDGHDVLDAWETVWNVERHESNGELVRGKRTYLRMEDCFGMCNDGPACWCSVDSWQPPTPDTTPPCLGLLFGGRPVTGRSPVTVDTAARQLAACGEHRSLLATYARRHGEPATWQADSDTHKACAPYLARALVDRAHEQSEKGAWQDTLDDLTSAVSCGFVLDRSHHEMVRKAGLRAGQNGNGYQRAPLVQRIHWLESAHSLVPEDTALAEELAATLVRQGTEALRRKDRGEGRARFQRALCVLPGEPAAQHALDALELAEVAAVITGSGPGRQPGLQRVGELLHRGFRAEVPAEELRAVYAWYCDRMTERIVEKALAGKKGEARRVLRQLEEVDPSWDERGTRADDGDVAGVLCERAVRLLGGRSGDYARQVPVLLAAAATFARLTGAEAEQQALVTVLPFAAKLVDAGCLSDLITLQAGLLITPGRCPEYDQLVAVAHHRRAHDRRADGEPAGAARDERTAAALRMESAQQIALPFTSELFPGLFDRSVPPPDQDDGPYTQETL